MSPKGGLRDALSKRNHKCGYCLSSSSALNKKLKNVSFLPLCLSKSPCPDPVVMGSQR